MRTDVELLEFADQFLLTVTSEAIRKCERAQRLGLQCLRPPTLKERLEARAMVLCMTITAMNDAGMFTKEQIQEALNHVYVKVIDRTWRGWTPGFEDELLEGIRKYAHALDGGEERFDFEEFDFEYARRSGVRDILVWSRVGSVVSSHYIALAKSLRDFRIVDRPHPQ